MRLVLPAFLVLVAATAVHASEAPAPDRTQESGWSAEGFVDPAFEAERAQIAFDDGGHAISLWAGRATSNDPFQILWSTLTGNAWSPAVHAFAPTSASERLPQLSRAPDGTIWAAWLRDDNFSGGAFHAPTLVAARLSGGAWSLPETVAVETPVLNEKALEIDFSLLAVSHDEAWLAWLVPTDGDPFSSDRDLVSSTRSAAGWSAPVTVSDNALSESRPLLVRSSTGTTTALFTFANAPSLLRAVRWDGSAWANQSPTDLTSLLIYGYDAQPDSGGAIRMIVDLREDEVAGVEYHIREFELNDSGFHPGPLLTSAPVLVGGENDPPDWTSVSLSPGRPCPLCADLPNELVFRVMWVDFSQGGTPKVFSSERLAGDYLPFELVGTSFETAYAYPKAVHDVAQDRWLATWTAPPTFSGRRRAKFAFTQEFAGDLAIGGTYIAPDTVRVTVLGSGDATGRTFRLYRLNWPAGQGSPPFSPPVPAAAVALPGNPYPGAFPFTVDDFPGPGRWFYYVELDASGSFPARSARSFNAVVVPEGGGGGGEPGPVTRLLSPRPQPAVSTVSLPYDLATAGNARLVVRDLRGRLVRTFDLGAQPAGAYRDENAPLWDGRDDDGASVPSGIYFATLTVDGNVAGQGVRVVLFR